MERDILDLWSSEFLFELKAASAKVNKQADVFARSGEIIHQLHLVFDDKTGDGFQFDDEFSIYDQIGFEVANNYALIMNLNQPIGFNLETRLRQFIKQGLLVNRLEKTRSKRAMNLHRKTDNLSGQVVFRFRDRIHRIMQNFLRRIFATEFIRKRFC